MDGLSLARHVKVWSKKVQEILRFSVVFEVAKSKELLKLVSAIF